MDTLWSLLLIGIVGAAVAWAVLRHSRRRGARRELREQVHTWEDEGGNVPDVPSVTPQPQRGNDRG